LRGTFCYLVELGLKAKEQMTRCFFTKIERGIKRPLSDGERTAIGGLILDRQLPAERRKRKRSLRKARQEVRLVELKAKGK
jgi:hypothetical protein